MLRKPSEPPKKGQYIKFVYEDASYSRFREKCGLAPLSLGGVYEVLFTHAGGEDAIVVKLGSERSFIGRYEYDIATEEDIKTWEVMRNLG